MMLEIRVLMRGRLRLGIASMMRAMRKFGHFARPRGRKAMSAGRYSPLVRWRGTAVRLLPRSHAGHVGFCFCFSSVDSAMLVVIAFVVLAMSFTGVFVPSWLRYLLCDSRCGKSRESYRAKEVMEVHDGLIALMKRDTRIVIAVEYGRMVTCGDQRTIIKTYLPYINGAVQHTCR